MEVQVRTPWVVSLIVLNGQPVSGKPWSSLLLSTHSADVPARRQLGAWLSQGSTWEQRHIQHPCTCASGLTCTKSFLPSRSAHELSSSPLRLVQFVVREGHFNVSMRLYKTPSYLQPYQLPTAAIPVTDTLYVLLKIEGQHQLKYFLLSVEDCWATPSADPYQDVRHELIEKG